MFEGTLDNLNSMMVRMIAIKEYEDEKTISILRDCFSLVFVSEGKISFSINGKENVFHSPTIICLSNRDEVSDVMLYDKAKVRVVYFDTVFLARSLTVDKLYDNSLADLIEKHYSLQLAPFVEMNPAKKFFVLDGVLGEHVSDLICKMKNQLVDQPDFFWSCRTRSYLLELLLLIERILYDYVDPEEDGMFGNSNKKKEFKKLLEYVMSNLDKHITLDALCKMFYTNTQSIERQFNKNMNITYKQYVKEQRFELSKHNLRFTDLTIKEIAAKVGYSSTQSFSKFFKEMSGTSAVAFRNEQVNARKTHPQLKIN